MHPFQGCHTGPEGLTPVVPEGEEQEMFQTASVMYDQLLPLAAVQAPLSFPVCPTGRPTMMKLMSPARREVCAATMEAGTGLEGLCSYLRLMLCMHVVLSSGTSDSGVVGGDPSSSLDREMDQCLIRLQTLASVISTTLRRSEYSTLNT